MSLHTTLGWRRNLLAETPEHARLIEADSPILFDHELAALRSLRRPPSSLGHDRCDLAVERRRSGPRKGDRPHLRRSGCRRRPRRAPPHSERSRHRSHPRVPVPMLLATGAVHHHLIHTGKRMKASIIVETGEARDVHQIACLIGLRRQRHLPLSRVRIRPRNRRADQGRRRSRAWPRPAPTPRNSRRPRPRSRTPRRSTYAKALQNYPHGARKRPAQDHVEDGHQRARQLPWRADFRSHRRRPEGHREVLLAAPPRSVGGIGFVEIARESLPATRRPTPRPVPPDTRRRAASSTIPASTASAAMARTTP